MARRSGRCADSSSRCADGSHSSLVRLLRSTAASFKAVNNRDKNYTVAKVTGRMEQVDASIARYLRALDQADREEGTADRAGTVYVRVSFVDDDLAEAFAREFA